MQGAIDISIISMIIGFLVLIIPVIIALSNRINIIGELSISIARMTIQLSLVGILLQFLFNLNKLWFTSLWFLFMIFIASLNVIKRSGIRLKYSLLINYAALLIPVSFMLSYLLLFVVRPEPYFDARHFIPLAGMLLGNSMNATSLVLERFYNGIMKGKKEYYSYISIGATVNEAIHPFLIKAYRAALMPTIATMTTMGLVALPGMMTGQILGGSSPITSIKYQIIIMIFIFCSTSLSSLLIISLSKYAMFDRYFLIRDEENHI